MDPRQSSLATWVALQLNLDSCDLEVVSGDASFRRYFRAFDGNRHWIAMDALPEKEDSHSFLAIALSWFQQGIQVPEIKAHDLGKGFLLLSDMGDNLLLSELNPESPDVIKGNTYYRQAINILADIQTTTDVEGYTLPPYDQALLDQEMSLFKDWLVQNKLALDLDTSEQEVLANVFTLLAESALSQPTVPVHRDYHSRNLMVLENGQLGVLDFQDAVLGPVTYDLVSLLRDCYIVWPTEDVNRWCEQFYEIKRHNKQLTASYDTFKKWFDWMGLQRHLKASGIFARLSIRDGKHGYLNDIPRTVDYLVKVSAEYAELRDFNTWLNNKLVPALGMLKGAA